MPEVIRRSSRRLAEIVRGDGAWADSLRNGEVGLDLPTAALAVVLAGAYGLGMGIFTLVHGVSSWPQQLAANVVKVPVLALISFALTCPAFFAANALGGLGLTAKGAFRLWAAAFVVFAAVLGALAPAAGLVSVLCNYSFAMLINLAFFAAAGLTAFAFVLRSVRVLHETGGRADAGPGRATRLRLAFAAWAVALALAGLQVGWRMRPLIGWRDAPFAWYRADGMTLWDGIRSEVFNIITAGGV
jgi:hypothetical protein